MYFHNCHTIVLYFPVFNEFTPTYKINKMIPKIKLYESNLSCFPGVVSSVQQETNIYLIAGFPTPDLIFMLY